MDSSEDLDFFRKDFEKCWGDLNAVFPIGEPPSPTKRDDSLVTEADIASEKSIISAINQAFPDDKIYAEESGLSSGDRMEGSFIWIIDPLDGTSNFSNGYPFSASLLLVVYSTRMEA